MVYHLSEVFSICCPNHRSDLSSGPLLWRDFLLAMHFGDSFTTFGRITRRTNAALCFEIGTSDLCWVKDICLFCGPAKVSHHDARFLTYSTSICTFPSVQWIYAWPNALSVAIGPVHVICHLDNTDILKALLSFLDRQPALNVVQAACMHEMARGTIWRLLWANIDSGLLHGGGSQAAWSLLTVHD